LPSQGRHKMDALGETFAPRNVVAKYAKKGQKNNCNFSACTQVGVNGQAQRLHGRRAVRRRDDADGGVEKR